MRRCSRDCITADRVLRNCEHEVDATYNAIVYISKLSSRCGMILEEIAMAARKHTIVSSLVVRT
eukprot:6183037-Pleurochrysis_carterae.AAC.1